VPQYEAKGTEKCEWWKVEVLVKSRGNDTINGHTRSCETLLATPFKIIFGLDEGGFNPTGYRMIAARLRNFPKWRLRRNRNFKLASQEEF